MKKKLIAILTVAVVAMSVMACGSKTVSVELTGCGDTPIKLIKEVQSIADLDVKDAKAIVDNVPQVVIENVTEEEAEEYKARLEAVGGTVNIK